MKQRACIQCNTRWTIDASSCPFCGGESKAVVVPPSAWEEAVRSASVPSAPAPVPASPAATPARRASGWARLRGWLAGRRA